MVNKAITISRTIYDPVIKDFVTSSADAKALPNVKKWITDQNPVIYWYILRIDNPPDADISQWAVELYAHQALTITEAYVDGYDRKFELKKREHDAWNEKYVLSIPRQIGIPIVGKGTRRIFFKVDIDCKEGLMHEYGISGKFVAKGMEPVKIKEKMFEYSCKVGEFKQIFDKDPHEASDYADKRLSWKYSTNSVHVFTNSFRMIHELYGYCNSKSVDRGVLLQKLHLLHTSFENVPEIAGKRITPLIHNAIRELDVIVDRDKFAPRFIKLCDSLVELLHIEVMGADMGGGTAYVPQAEPVNVKKVAANFVNGQNDKCQACGNVIDSSNKSLICKECGTRFCGTCEGWFREERKRGQKPICEDCLNAEQERLREVAERKVQMEREKEERLERERKEKEEHERLIKEKKDAEIQRKERIKKEREEAAKKKREEEEHEQLIKEKKDAEIQWKERIKKEREEAERNKERRRKLEKEYNIVWEQSKQANNIKTTKHDTIRGFLGFNKSVEKEIKNQIEIRQNFIGMKFTYVPAGEFMMGSEEGRDNEQPVHKVTIKKPFYLGTYPVTQREWKAVMGNNPSHFKGDDLPVENVSWYDVQEFIKKLSEKEGGNKYRLPSEAEWEYACRSGTTTSYSFGDDESKLGDYAWYGDNSGRKTHNVGQKKPNPWGMYDMHGNVWEWIQDKFHGYYKGAPSNGSAWDYGGGSSCVVRGGSWSDNASGCHSACRFSSAPGDRRNFVGFRLLRSP